MKFIPEGIRRPFRHVNYCYYIGGQAASVLGYWMQMIATSWLIYSLTESSLILGMVNFFALLPALVLSPFAGMIADRYCKKHILYVSQFGAAFAVGVMTLLVFFEVVQVWHIMVYAVILGCLVAFENPARQAFIVEMVGKEDLQNAIAVNSSVFNLGRLVGPALASFLIPFFGEAFVFAINTCTYLIISYSLYKITTMGYPSKKESIESPLLALGHGFQFAFVHKGIFFCLFIIGLGSLFNSPQAALLPAYAVEILSGNSSTLGLLTTAVGLGALTAALLLASRTDTKGLLPMLTFGTIAFTFGMYGFGFASNIWFALFSLICIGYGMVMQMATVNTLIQLLTPDEYRGRIMALFSMMMMGMGTFGSLLGGSSGEFFGIQRTLLFCAIGLTFALVGVLPFLIKHVKKELR